MAAGLALIAFGLGVLSFRLGFLHQPLSQYADQISFIALCYMVFAVGVTIGTQRDVWGKVLKERWRLILLPIGTLLSSALAATVVGEITGLSSPVSAAIGSACGWYSLSGVAVAKIWGAEAGLLAFTVNFLRELAAFGLVPLIAKHCRFAAIALCGATAADTTLPVIAKSTNPESALIGLISGGLITASVPFVIAFLSSLSS
ncbi:MAG: lysine exporter LysO family protein [Armatimonadota bacterium]|nr:lysine exporter LysO family protein [Armatimonadota bacterium]MDW8141887.1 lysine exporter LysO family protein [Armatimonadota bacterium]